MKSLAMLKRALSISVMAMYFALPQASAQQLNLQNTLCGPPLDVIAAVEARGYVNEPIFNVSIPDQIANRTDYALLAYTLGPEEIAAQVEKGGYVTQRIIWILRTDRAPGRPFGWACIYNELPILERHREDAFQRGRDIQSSMSGRH